MISSPSTQPLSPLRQRMLEDMRMRKLAAYLKRSSDAATVLQKPDALDHRVHAPMVRIERYSLVSIWPSLWNHRCRPGACRCPVCSSATSPSARRWSQRIALESAHRAGIDLLGLTTLHASSRHEAGFLMGFAAHAPHELENAVKKLAKVLRALRR